VFEDRSEAGRRLAARLAALAGGPIVVLGLPRGGVPVAAAVARALGAPLEVLVARKLGSPTNPEFAVGAISEAGTRYLDERSAARFAPSALAAVERTERIELARRVAAYRGNRAVLDLTGFSALVVDDGVATGATMIAACRAARSLGAARVVAAVPVAPRHWQDALRGEADDCIAVLEPDPFVAVGTFYRTFTQTTDAEVLEALAGTDRLAPPS
jgi:putative phosphoribosyl transferase